MSYILEALKKSEQERNPNRVPDLDTHHQQVSTSHRRPFPWVWLVAVLLLVNLLVIYWFFIKESAEPRSIAVSIQQPEDVALVEPQPEQPVKVDETAVKEVQAPPQETTQETIKETRPEPEVIEEVVETKPVLEAVPMPKPTARPAPKKPVFENLPHISELSMAIQKQLPAMEFSTHIYVKDGGSFVIINNQSLSDGMGIGDGLMLEEIVREGVILSYRDRLFTLRSMESWNQN